MKLSPQDGGCWYCHEDDEKEKLFFCWEFDTFIHISCIEKRIKEVEKSNQLDQELEIIRKEFIL